MSNAAIYLHPNGFDTSGTRLLGRHSAGESFLRGFLRHGDVERFYFWNVLGRPQAELEALVDRIHPPSRPVTWIPRHGRSGLQAAGVLNMPGPDILAESWLRRVPGARAYGVCGVTHTTATANVMRVLSDMMVGPVEGYDALICTSNAVRASVEAHLEGIRDYLAQEFGARRRPEPLRVTIPLGVNVDDFATSQEDRSAWRERLGIPADHVVALYVGRFNVREKMNPALMAMALERAAKSTGRPVHWVNSGWAESEAEGERYHADTQDLCPSVCYHAVDGRPADVRRSIWSVADFFISFSDNIQETFGLTPVEAMAAGLPCIVTDWNGYKDTVRHGQDGFRIPTYAPAPGAGRDLAYWFEAQRLSYTNYVGAAAQFTAIDFAEADAALTILIMNADFRRRLGAQAKARAREVFDWAAVIPAYQALWAEQNALRLASPPAMRVMTNPFRPDPFAIFGGYPTHHVADPWLASLAPGTTWVEARDVLASPLATQGAFNGMTLAEAEQVVAFLAARQIATIGEVAEMFPSARRPILARGLLWLARFGIVILAAPAP